MNTIEDRLNFVTNSVESIDETTFKDVLEVLESLDYNTDILTRNQVVSILINDNVAGKAILPLITE